MGAGPVKNANSGGRRRARYGVLSEINVTPFVDVMLVLLVVFMVSAATVSVGHLVSPPEAAMEPLPVARDPLVIQVTAQGDIYIQDKQIGLAELVDQLDAIRAERERAGGDLGVVLLSGDAAADYNAVYQVLAVLQAAGVKAGLVADGSSR